MSVGTDGGPGVFGILDRLAHRVAFTADQLSALICAVLIVATTIAMIIYQWGITVPWLDDLLSMLLIWFIYLGAIPLAIDNTHISMDALYLRFPRAVRRVVNVLIALVGAGLCAFVAKIGYHSMIGQMNYGTLMPGGQIPAWLQFLALPVAFGLMTLAYLSFLVAVLRRTHKEPGGLGEGPDAPSSLIQSE
jgi:TRAP-type C4-dicarboxylate transport system permease small subunit